MDAIPSKTPWVAIAIAMACLVLLVAASQHGVHATTSYTCLECRAVLQKQRWFGVPSSKVLENDCSRWHARTHSSHEHQWCWCGSETIWDPLNIGYACGRRHPIWGMPAEVQLEFMKTASKEELESFWQTMKSAPREAQESSVSEVYEKVIEAR